METTTTFHAVNSLLFAEGQVNKGGVSVFHVSYYILERFTLTKALTDFTVFLGERISANL